MSAHDNLSKQLFNGTHVKLIPGDIIKPHNQIEENKRHINYGVNPVYGEDVGEHAYATTDLEEAKWYANESARKANAKPHVYEVKRLGKTKVRPAYGNDPEALEDFPEAANVMEHLSKQGFKVVKKVK